MFFFKEFCNINNTNLQKCSQQISKFDERIWSVSFSYFLAWIYEHQRARKLNFEKFNKSLKQYCCTTEWIQGPGIQYRRGHNKFGRPWLKLYMKFKRQQSFGDNFFLKTLIYHGLPVNYFFLVLQPLKLPENICLLFPYFILQANAPLIILDFLFYGKFT